MPDTDAPAQPDAFALKLRRLLDEHGLDVDMHGAIFKTANKPHNAGRRAEHVLGQVLYLRLRALGPQGANVAPAPAAASDAVDQPLSLARPQQQSPAMLLIQTNERFQRGSQGAIQKRTTFATRLSLDDALRRICAHSAATRAAIAQHTSEPVEMGYELVGVQRCDDVSPDALETMGVELVEQLELTAEAVIEAVRGMPPTADKKLGAMLPAVDTLLTMSQPLQQWKKWEETLLAVADDGPPGAGWASKELRSLRDAVAELVHVARSGA